VKSFLQRFGHLVLGVLHGFDRLRLRGSKRQLCYVTGAASYLGHIQVRLNDYKAYTQWFSEPRPARVDIPRADRATSTSQTAIGLDHPAAALAARAWTDRNDQRRPKSGGRDTRSPTS
jgi:hypothetical protein